MHTIGTDQIIISSMKLFICLVLFLMNMNNYVFNYITTTSMIFSCLFLGYFNILSKGKDYKHHFILGRNGLAVYKLVSHGACPALPHPALPCPALPRPAPPCNQTHYSSSGLAGQRHEDKHGHCSGDHEHGV